MHTSMFQYLLSLFIFTGDKEGQKQSKQLFCRLYKLKLNVLLFTWFDLASLPLIFAGFFMLCFEPRWLQTLVVLPQSFNFVEQILQTSFLSTSSLSKYFHTSLFNDGAIFVEQKLLSLRSTDDRRTRIFVANANRQEQTSLCYLDLVDIYVWYRDVWWRRCTANPKTNI